MARDMDARDRWIRENRESLAPLPEALYPGEHILACIRALWTRHGDDMLRAMAETGGFDVMFAHFPDARNMVRKGMKNGRLTGSGMVSLRKMAQQYGHFADPIASFSVCEYLFGTGPCGDWQKAAAWLAASIHLDGRLRDSMLEGAKEGAQAILPRFAWLDDWFHDILLVGSWAGRLDLLLDAMDGLRSRIPEVEFSGFGGAKAWMAGFVNAWRGPSASFRWIVREIRKDLRILPLCGDPWEAADFIREDAIPWLLDHIPQDGMDVERARLILSSLDPRPRDSDIALMDEELEKVAAGELPRDESPLFSFVLPRLMGEDIPEDSVPDCAYSFPFIRKVISGGFSVDIPEGDAGDTPAAENGTENPDDAGDPFGGRHPDEEGAEDPPAAENGTEGPDDAADAGEGTDAGEADDGFEDPFGGPDEAGDGFEEAEGGEADAPCDAHAAEAARAPEGPAANADRARVISYPEPKPEPEPERRKTPIADAMEEAFASTAKIHPWNRELTPDEKELLGNVGGLSRILKAGRERRESGGRGQGQDRDDSDSCHLWLEMLESDSLDGLRLVSSHYGLYEGISDILARSASGMDVSPAEAAALADFPWLMAACVAVSSLAHPERDWGDAIIAVQGRLPQLDRFFSLLQAHLVSGRAFPLFGREALCRRTCDFLEKAQTSSINYEPAEKVLRRLFGRGSELGDGLMDCMAGRGNAGHFANVLGGAKKRNELIDRLRGKGRPIIAWARQKLASAIDEGIGIFREWAGLSDSRESVANILAAVYPQAREEAERSPHGRFFLRRLEDVGNDIPADAGDLDPEAFHLALDARRFLDSAEGDPESLALELARKGVCGRAEDWHAAHPDASREIMAWAERWRALAERMERLGACAAGWSFLQGKMDGGGLAAARAALRYAGTLEPVEGLGVMADLAEHLPLDFDIPEDSSPRQVRVFDGGAQVFRHGLLDSRCVGRAFWEKAPNFWDAEIREGDFAFPRAAGRIVAVRGRGDFIPISFARLCARLSEEDCGAAIYFDGELSPAQREEIAALPWKSIPLLYDSRSRKLSDGFLAVDGGWPQLWQRHGALPEAAVPLLEGLMERDGGFAMHLGAAIDASRPHGLHDLLALVAAHADGIADQDDAVLLLLDYAGDLEMKKIIELAGGNARASLEALDGSERVALEARQC